MRLFIQIYRYSIFLESLN